jgi:phosphatidylglycerol---prolipoprotein diacylglyceryl transferase
MYPTLHHSDHLLVRSYGLALVLSFVVGFLLAHMRARRAGVDRRHLSRLCMLILFSAVIGSRALHVAEHASTYAADPWRSLRIGDGGLSMLGGLPLALLVSFLYLRAIGEPFAKLADVCAPSIALGEAITRIGCFLNGCCFGTPSTLPWATVFPAASPAGRVFPDTPIHPTQLYASLYSLLARGRQRPHRGLGRRGRRVRLPHSRPLCRRMRERR